MKKLKLKEEIIVTLPIGNTEKFIVGDHLISVLAMPSDPSKGINYAEMSARCDLIKKLKTEEEFVLIETVEHKMLVDALKTHRYPFVSTEIKDFIESIIDLKDTDIKEA